MKCDTVGATHKYNYMYIYRTIHNIGWERRGIKKNKENTNILRKTEIIFRKINTNSRGRIGIQLFQ